MKVFDGTSIKSKNKMLGCNRIFDNKHVTNLDFLEGEIL